MTGQFSVTVAIELSNFFFVFVFLAAMVNVFVLCLVLINYVRHDQTPEDIAKECGAADIKNLLVNYKMIPNHDILKTIDNGDFSSFEKILNGEIVNSKYASLDVVLDRLFANKMGEMKSKKSKFFNYIVNHDGKHGWNINDYSIILAYCAQTSDIKLLKKVIDNVHSSKYDLSSRFKDNDPASHTKRESISILDFCIRSYFIYHDEQEFNVDLNVDRSIFHKPQEMCKINDKKNDNHKCFEYFVKKTNILHLCYRGRDAQLIYDCFENLKNSFVECLLTNDLCKDYTAVLIHCTKYPQTWKLPSLRLLLTRKRNLSNLHDSKYNLFGCDSDLEKYVKQCKPEEYQIQRSQILTKNTKMNCLHWCVNTGMEPQWIQEYTHDDGFKNFGTSGSRSMLSKLYNKDSINSGFEAFKMILECENLGSDDVNKLLNTRMKDDIHIVEACMSNSLIHPQFINYLIDNNGKYKWNIDFVQTNVLQLACLVGNYDALTKLIKNKNTYHNSQTKHVKIQEFGFEPTTTVNVSTHVGEKMVPNWNKETLSTMVRVSDEIMNSFASLNVYKELSNDARFEESKNSTKRNESQNLLYWCVNTSRSFVLNSTTHGQNNGSSSDYLLRLSDNKRQFLCLGYLRNVAKINYPDNIATILSKYFDWGAGNTQCFEYLLQMTQTNDAIASSFQDGDGDNNSDSESKNDTTKEEASKRKEKKSMTKISLYPTVVYDCTIYGRVRLMEILLEACKKHHYNLKASDGQKIYHLLRSSFHFACYMASSIIVKFLLSLFKNENNFDINAIDDPILLANQLRSERVRVFSLNKNDDQKKGKGGDIGITPLMAVAISSYEMIDDLKKDEIYIHGSLGFHFFRIGVGGNRNAIEELKCFKILLDQANIGVSVRTPSNGKSIFLHCVEQNKQHLIEHMFCVNFGSNGNNDNNHNNDIKFDFKTKSSDNENCLDIAMNKQNLSLLKFLLKNIIKYKIFTNDEIANMCQQLLIRCVDKHHTELTSFRAYRSDTKRFYYQAFLYLLTDTSLECIFKGGCLKLTSQFIDLCFVNKRTDILEFLLKNDKYYAHLTDTPVLKMQMEKLIY